jgi:hypothetical protein
MKAMPVFLFNNIIAVFFLYLSQGEIISGMLVKDGRDGFG